MDIDFKATAFYAGMNRVNEFSSQEVAIIKGVHKYLEFSLLSPHSTV